MFAKIVTKRAHAERACSLAILFDVIDIEAIRWIEPSIFEELQPNSRIGLHDAHLVGQNVELGVCAENLIVENHRCMQKRRIRQHKRAHAEFCSGFQALFAVGIGNDNALVILYEFFI